MGVGVYYRYPPPKNEKRLVNHIQSMRTTGGKGHKKGG